MGLMQLLKVGRSLGEARDRPHRYKLPNQAMPTFGHVGGMKVGQKSDQSATVVDEGENELAEMKAGVEEQTMKMQAAETMRKAPTTNAFPIACWALKANPFKSSIKPAPRPAVQGELSLDKVKVVRIDLSDSDLELVAAMRPVAAAEVNPRNVFVAGAESKKPSLLGRVTGRLFRAKAH